jgi:prevent-host-death family protein
MITRTVEVREAQSRLNELLPSVTAGEEIVLTENNQPVARLVPMEYPSGKRVPGLHAGMVWVSEDFDAPLDEEFWNSNP